MARARLNPRLVKIHFNYDVGEAARLLGVHKNTVRAWIKRDGLPVIDDHRPTLIHGQALRAFLEVRKAAAKRPCPAGTLFCFKCRVPRRPALDMAEFMPSEGRAGRLSALCEDCGTVMHRLAAEASIGLILPDLAVQFTQGQKRIAGWTTPDLNSAFR